MSCEVVRILHCCDCFRFHEGSTHTMSISKIQTTFWWDILVQSEYRELSVET